MACQNGHSASLPPIVVGRQASRQDYVEPGQKRVGHGSSWNILGSHRTGSTAVHDHLLKIKKNNTMSLSRKSTTFHATFDLDALIHRGEAARMAGYVRFAGSNHWATEPEIVAHATILKAKGFDVLPACDKTDAKGNCLGHLPE
jgi:hypothetical protein